jgi:ATP-dependent Lon protease
VSTSTASPARPNLLMPVLPLRDVSLFPGASLELIVARLGTIRVLEMSARMQGLVFALAQKDPDQPLPTARDFFGVGTVARILSAETTADGNAHVELDGVERARAACLFGLDTLIAEIEPLEEGDPGDDWGSAVEALARYIHAHADLRDFLNDRRRSSEPMGWVNLACQHLPITASARQRLLEADACERCLKISRGLDALLRKEQTT